MATSKDAQLRIVMRKMQASCRNAQSKLKAFGKSAVSSVLAVGTIAILSSTVSAQTQAIFQNYPISSTTMSMRDNPVSSGTGNPIVDATYSGNRQTADVKKASYLGDLGYQALQDAESCPGSYGCTRCDISWYFSAEFLGFRREGDRRFSLTQSQFMTDSEFEFGTRLTMGRMFDCANAIEFVYVGPFQWTRGSTLAIPDGVNSRFLTFPIELADAFTDADQQDQSWLARSSSIELNRRKWAWDAVSTLIGMRYFNYEERYGLASIRSAPQPAPLSGRYSDEIDNHMVGAQVGGDVFFTTSLKSSISMRGKAGIYGNFATREVRLVEDGTTTFFNGNDEVDLAGLFEFGINFNYQITPSIRLSGGYELWYMPGIASVSNQNPNILTPNSGFAINMEEDLFLHGFNAGVQVLY